LKKREELELQNVKFIAFPPSLLFKGESRAMTLSLRRSIVAIIKPLPASPLKKGEEPEL